MTKNDLAAIAVGLFAFVFFFIPAYVNRKEALKIVFGRGLTKYHVVKQKPYSGFRAFAESVAAGLIIGALAWWGNGAR